MISKRLLKKTVNLDRFRELLEKKEWSEAEKAEVLAYPGFGNGRSDYFTPGVVCDFMAQLALVTLPNGPWDVLEPAAGIGKIAHAVQLINPDHRIRMFELSYQYAEVCRRLLPTVEVLQGDAVELFSKEDRLYDLVIMNPPFGPEKSMGPYGSEGYFLLQGLKRLKPDGVLIAVVPDGLLSTGKTLELRKNLLSQYKLLAGISLPGETFAFSGTGVKTSILVVKNRPSSPEDKVHFMLSESVGWDSSGRPKECDLDKLFSYFTLALLDEKLIVNAHIVGQLEGAGIKLPAEDQPLATPVHEHEEVQEPSRPEDLQLALF